MVAVAVPVSAYFAGLPRLDRPCRRSKVHGAIRPGATIGSIEDAGRDLLAQRWSATKQEVVANARILEPPTAA